MTRRPQEKHDPLLGLGPFSYSFRPSPAGRFGTILIKGPKGAPAPARGDLLTLTLDDDAAAQFEVTKVARASEGWWASCERRGQTGEDGD
ncbi:hypothetical protein [Caulobacter sp. BP25]|uniref:hypothetical protein n=1 Tax=Caulobacter sp. BP25 TaxID=2048900 RepID=UPI000C12BB1D|nr:hypothetical protein [Caulobacter sp. BP25]PHY21179.1 hypothetical protein CSW59_05340 [Caulobacter sp. BP25]